MVSEFLLLSRREDFTPVCKGCGSHRMQLVPSRVRVRLSEETRLERLADPGRWGHLDENDPQSMARVLKRLGPELGEDFGGELEEAVEEAMQGAEAGLRQDEEEVV